MRATDSLTDRHFKYLDEVAETALAAGRSEKEFVDDFMDLRKDDARQAYKTAVIVDRIYRGLGFADEVRRVA